MLSWRHLDADMSTATGGVKRCAGATDNHVPPCSKLKRRKQAMPIRITGVEPHDPGGGLPPYHQLDPSQPQYDNDMTTTEEDGSYTQEYTNEQSADHYSDQLQQDQDSPKDSNDDYAENDSRKLLSVERNSPEENAESNPYHQNESENPYADRENESSPNAERLKRNDEPDEDNKDRTVPTGHFQESLDILDRYQRLKLKEMHHCNKCGLIFPNNDALKIHMDMEHIEKNGRTPQQFECKTEPYDGDESNAGNNSHPNSGNNMNDPRIEAWGTDFQAKMADLYKNALGFNPELSKEPLPNNFNPLCPTFSLFSTAIPPQRPLMEPIRIFNPEAYCELCSKEFCNKYFLKTHKANKHGIYENAPSSSSSDQINVDQLRDQPFIPTPFTPSSMKFKNNMMLSDYAKSYEAALLVSQRHKAKIQRMMEEARDLEKNNLEGQPATGMLPRLPPLDDMRNSSDDTSIPENFIYKTENHLGGEEPFVTPTPRKLSPDSSKKAKESGFNSDTLRRLGVINPEAFCKICCKEYCNKYFLKTHKIKRHGLLPSPTDRPAKDFPQMGERKDGQTSPLNLIMTEENQDKPQHSSEAIRAIKIYKDGMFSPHQNNSRPVSTHSVDSNNIDTKKENSPDESNKSDQNKTSPTPIFISEDLQKLQTMISQLNDLSVNKVVECYVCKKEFENNYVLQFHLMSDHGVSMPGSIENFPFPSVPSDEASENGQQQKVTCNICEKDFPSLLLLKKHVEEFHTPKLGFADNSKLFDNIQSDKDSNSQRERRASMSLTPTNSYCEICNKELCNKYFMKTHMQRMHGIEIENGTQIGGVICDICNKELCSKYFLRVHKHNTHGIIEPGAPLPQMRNLSAEPETFTIPQAQSPVKPSESGILNNRFIAHFVEVCPFCSRRFRTSKWLKAHLLSDHGKSGIEKWKELEVHYKAQGKLAASKSNKPPGNAISIPDAPNVNNSPNMPVDLQDRMPYYSKLIEPKLLNMFNLNNSDVKTYNCSYCPFTTSVLSFLYVHEKSHIQGPEMDILCPMCPESFNKPEALQIHIITSHSLPEWRDKAGPDESSTSVTNQNVLCKTPDASDEADTQNNDNGKPEIFECYECEFKTTQFEDMENHLREQHLAVREGEPADGDNFGEDLRRKKIPPVYAVPKDSALDGQEEIITMQPFVIEENAPEESGGKFVPSVVFLPVKKRATSAITISFNLTPA